MDTITLNGRTHVVADYYSNTDRTAVIVILKNGERHSIPRTADYAETLRQLGYTVPTPAKQGELATPIGV